MKKEQNDLMVSPEILLKLGFIRIEEAEYNNLDVPSFRHPVVCYVEKECRRQAILLMLEPMTYSDGTPWYDVTVYLQDDVGCGFMQVPMNWAGLNVDRLNDLHRFSAGVDLPGYKYLRFTFH